MKRTEQEAGMSLIEVMVAIAILASGLLGLGAMQSKSLVMNQSSHYRSIAADMATDLAERVRANRTPFVTSSDASPLPHLPPDFTQCPAPSSGTTVTCTTQATPTNSSQARQSYQVSTEMNDWFALLRIQLGPSATYTLTKTETPTGAFPYTLQYTLTITWNDDRTQSGTSGNYSYTAVIE